MLKPTAAKEVRALMEDTESILTKIIYIKDYLFSETFVNENGIARIPGNRKWEEWSTVNSHGGFRYGIKLFTN